MFRSKSTLKRIAIQKNTKRTPKAKILDQMNEPRPLPMGRKEFDEWSTRIISGALLPIPELEEDKIKLEESQRFALAEMIMHIGPTESHKPDAYFIHQLRKGAVNQVAYAFMQEMREKKKLRTEAIETEND